MRAPLLALSMLTLALGTAPLAAQSPIPPVRLPFPQVLADTVIVSSLALANGATYATPPLTLDHVLIGGLTPTQFRASKYADFRDAPWTLYPSGVPRFSGSNSGACSAASTIRMVAHFQVRAPRPGSIKGFVHSNVARDTTCLMIGG